MEKAVYGTDIEERIVVENLRQHGFRMGPYRLLPVGVRHFGEPLQPLQLLYIRRLTTGGQSIELLEDTLLHLARGLVGESHGEDMLVTVCSPRKQFPDIVSRQFVGLARTG